MNSIFDCDEINRIIYSFDPYKFKQLNRYYYFLGRSLKITIEKNSYIYYTISRLSNYSLSKIDFVCIKNYSGICGFTDNIGLKKLNPKYLYINKGGFRLFHMTNLIEVNLKNNFNIHDNDISSLVSIKKINIVNTNITDKGIESLININTLLFGLDYDELCIQYEHMSINISINTLKKLIKLNNIIIYYGYDTESYSSVDQIEEI